METRKRKEERKARSSFFPNRKSLKRKGKVDKEKAWRKSKLTIKYRNNNNRGLTHAMDLWDESV